MEKFEKKLKDSAPPSVTSSIAVEVIAFLRQAQKIRLPSFTGYGGLYRSEIEVSFKRSDISPNIILDDIWWAIEYLDDKLREYFNTKSEDT